MMNLTGNNSESDIQVTHAPKGLAPCKTRDLVPVSPSKGLPLIARRQATEQRPQVA